MLERLVDNGLSQEDISLATEETGDIFHAAVISDAVESSQMGKFGHVVTVEITDNIRIPAFSELEILAQVKGDDRHCYMLESNLKNLSVARAVVMPDMVVPVRLLNPTGDQLIYTQELVWLCCGRSQKS